MTQAEAATYLAHAKALVEAVIENALDHAHATIVRMGATEEMIDEAMQRLYAEFDEQRRVALIQTAEITAKRVEDAHDELH